MKLIFHTSTLFVLLTFGSSLAYACSCADPSLRQKFRGSDAVFVGEVTEFKERPEDKTDEDLKYFFYQVTFKVEKQWKGKRQSQITALADYDSPGNCNDLDLSVGKRILVFAPREHGQLLIERECGPSRSADYAKDEIKKLGNFFYRTYSFFYPYPKF
jgi:hypothetical protein